MKDLGLYTLFNGLTIIPIEVVFADRAVRINGNNKILAAVLYSTMYALFLSSYISYPLCGSG